MEMFLPITLIILVVLFLTAALLFLSVAYYRLLHQVEQLSHQQHAAPQTQRHAEKIIETAHKQALEIVGAAERKAAELLTSSQVFAQQRQQDLDRSLDSASQNELEAYKKTLELLRKQTQTQVADLTTNLEQAMIEHLDRFSKDLVVRQQQIEVNLEQHADGESAQVQESLAQHRKQALAQLDKEITSLVKDVVQQVAGKTFTSADHEGLVLRALEEAKNHDAFHAT